MNHKDNAIIADFIGKRITRDLPGDKQQWQLPMCEGYYPSTETLEFHKRWERLMPVWYKFRDLKFEGVAKLIFIARKAKVEDAILNSGPSPSEACKLLAEGIRWYNSTTQNKESHINQTVKK